MLRILFPLAKATSFIGKKYRKARWPVPVQREGAGVFPRLISFRLEAMS